MDKIKINESFDYTIGIDCGVNTGFAVWSIERKDFLLVESMEIHKALFQVMDYIKREKKVKVFIEDARLRKWFGSNSESKKQGAGSVKRDSKIWEDFCKDMGIPFVLVNPKDNKTKLDSTKFKTYTGWTGRTNEHARDAGMLVFQRNR